MRVRLTHGKALLAAVLVSVFASSVSGSVTSVDLLEFQSNSEFYDGPVYVIHTTSNHNTDKFNFFLDNRQLSEGVSGKVQNTVTADITSQTSKAVYGTRETGKQPISKPEATTLTIGTAPLIPPTESKIRSKVNNNARVQNTCWDLQGDGIDHSDYLAREHVGLDPFYGIKVYCVKKGEQLGTVGEITSNPNDVFETVWEIRNNEGKIERATISNADMGQGQCERIGPNSRVCFQGAVSSGKNSPVPTDELVLHDNDISENNGFRVIDRGDYRTYLNSIPGMSDRIDRWGSDSSNPWTGNTNREDVTRTVRQNAEEAATSHDSSEFTDARFVGTGIGSGKIELDVKNGIWPQFTVELRACRNVDLSNCNAFVNIKRTVGKPRITDVSSQKFSELETGRIEATYKNVGGAEGSFSARVSQCGPGFSFTGVAERAVLGAGESTTVSFPISFSSQSTNQRQITESCTVQVEELGTGETVSTSVQVTGEQQSECTPGNQFTKTETVQVDGENLERDVIYECNSNGLGTHRVKSCSVDERAKARGSTYECVKEGGEDDDDDNGGGKECQTTLVSNPVGNDLTAPDPVCHFNKLVSGVYGTLTAIAMFFAFLFGYGQRIWITKTAELSGTALSILGRDVRAQWVIGLITGFLFAWFTAGLLSNPVVKWGLILGIPAYLILKARAVGTKTVVKTFLPV